MLHLPITVLMDHGPFLNFLLLILFGKVKNITTTFKTQKNQV